MERELQKSVARNASTLVSGRLSASVISFIGTILLVRGLGASDYGALNVAWALPFILSLVADLGLSGASIYFVARGTAQEQKGFVGNSVRTALRAVGATGIVFSIAVYLMADSVTFLLLSDMQYAPVFRIAALGIFASSLFNVTLSVLLGFEKMRAASASIIMQTLVRSIGAPVAVYIGLGVSGAMACFVIASFASALLNLISIAGTMRSVVGSSEIGVRPEDGHSLLGQMVSYGFPVSLSSMLLNSMVPAVNLVLPVFATLGEIGEFNVVATYATVLWVVSAPFADTLFPLFSKLDPEKDSVTLKRMFHDTASQVAIFMTPAIFIIAAVPLFAVQSLFGAGHDLAVEYLPIYLMSFVGTALGSLAIGGLLKGQGVPSRETGMSILNIVVVFSLGALWAPLMGIFAFLFSFVAGGLVGLLAGQIWVRRRFDLMLPKKILGIILCGLTAYLVAPQIVRLLPQMHWVVEGILIIALSTAVYVLMLALTRTVSPSFLEQLRDSYRGTGILYVPVLVMVRILLPIARRTTTQTKRAQQQSP